MALRGGVYVAFLVGAAVTWFMKQQADKRRKNKSNDDEVALSETELANPREVLKNSDWHVRLKAIRLIADQHSIEAIPDLTSALSDEDSDVRDAAVQALVGYIHNCSEL